MKGAKLALSMTAMGACVFVQVHLGQPTLPDPDHWLLVPVAAQELPPDLLAEAGRPRRPGVLLHRHLQIVPRAMTGLRGGGTVRFSAYLGQGASLHTFFGARGLQTRDGAMGTTLFISRKASPELHRVNGAKMTRQPCALEAAGAGEGRMEVTIKLRGPEAALVIRGPQKTTHAACTVQTGAGSMIGFRAGQAAVVLDSMQMEDPSGRVLFEYSSRGGAAHRLAALALTLVAVLLAWLLAAGLASWLLGRGFQEALDFAAWASLPLLLLPVLQWLDMGALAHGLRLAKTSTMTLRLGLAALFMALVWAMALLIRSRRLRCKEHERQDADLSLARLLSQQQARVSGVALAVHALLLAVLTLLSGRGCLAAAGLQAPLAGEVMATVAAALALPIGSLLLLRWLIPGQVVKLMAVEALSWAPSMVAAALALALMAAGMVESWNTPFYLLAAAAASLVFKLLFFQVNAQAVRGVNWASLTCCVLLAFTAEGTVRQTYLDTAWSTTPAGRYRSHDLLGWRKADKEIDYILNKQRPTRYPLDSFPVAFAKRKPAGSTRIVCLGGSSTGGAFQMDNLDSFFPAELQRILDRRAGSGRYEVINQGVGGWNTFHIWLYLKLTVARLRPDILILYVGHNDIMTKSSETYRQYWNRYRMQHSSLRGVMEVLNRCRLFVGFRSLLTSLRGSSSQGGAISNVPVSDARDNLERIITLARSNAARVVLLSEAINTQATTLGAYRKMQSEVASQQGQHYLDTNGIFWKLRQEDLFLDHNHLTGRGHQHLARVLGKFLITQGLVRAAGAAGK